MPTFNFKFIFISIFLSLLFLHTCNSVSILDLDGALASSEIDARARRVCTKKLEDCLEEEEMESESNRRVLVMQRKYISYETLRRTWSHVLPLVLLTMIAMAVIKRIITTEGVKLLQDVLEVSKVSKP
ncbi:hypothetical protein GOBAR_DD26727 [Gossypium barbadense]|nr:hypothetical protein GOBAR_DD26727 [Gossypium barbadense]